MRGLQLKAQRERALQLKAQQVLQFTCFTGTKVLILTQEGASGEGVAALRTTVLELQRETDAAQGAAGAQFTCVTSTKVLILTQKLGKECASVRAQRRSRCSIYLLY
jgi:hypothetical protein